MDIPNGSPCPNDKMRKANGRRFCNSFNNDVNHSWSCWSNDFSSTTTVVIVETTASALEVALALELGDVATQATADGCTDTVMVTLDEEEGDGDAVEAVRADTDGKSAVKKAVSLIKASGKAGAAAGTALALGVELSVTVLDCRWRRRAAEWM